MSQSPISIPPDMARFVEERKKIRREYQESLNAAQNLEQLTVQTRTYNVAQAQLMAPLTPSAVPPQEMQAVLPRIEQEIAAVNRIEQQIQAEQAAIATIQQKAKNLMMTLYILGGSAVLIIIIVILFTLHIL
jgi:hypothetical protein